jgi:hypothetical protein
MTFQGQQADYRGIYNAAQQPAGQNAQGGPIPDLMAELAQIGVTSLVGLTDEQLQAIASRLTAHRNEVIVQQQAAQQQVQQAAQQQAQQAQQQQSAQPGSPQAPSQADPTSAAFRAQYSIPQDIRTVGDITQIPGTSAADFATAQSQNMSLVDWYKYQLQKVSAAQQGQILGESPQFVAQNTPQGYLANTLNGGNISMYGPNAGPEQLAADNAARAEAMRQLGLPPPSAPVPTAAPAPYSPPSASPAPAYSPPVSSSPAVVTQPTVSRVTTTPTAPAAPAITQPAPMTLTEFNAANRAGVIARGTAAGTTVNTATVNNTIASNYEKYLATIKQP